MNLTVLDNLFSQYFNNEIDWETFINRLNLFYPNYEQSQLIESYIELGISQKNALQLEYALFFIFQEKLENKTISIMTINHLLLEDWHYSHQDLILLIKAYHTEISIPFLVQAFELQLEYLEYNDSSSFHNNLLWAIFNIGGCKYIDKILLLHNKISSDLDNTIELMSKKCQ